MTTKLIPDEDMDLDAADENLEIIEAAKIPLPKKELKPGQKAVAVRRRIEEYLENKLLREYHGLEEEA